MGASTSREEDSDLASAAAREWEESPRVRWAVDTHAWRPSLPEWHFLLSLLSRSQRAAVLGPSQLADRKRALVSRLMQRRCAQVVLGLSDDQLHFGLTKGGKPYLDLSASAMLPQPCAPNFNYNVSHEGHLVVLASEPVLLVGVDLSAPFELRGGEPIGDFAKVRETFSNVLTEEEWEVVESEIDDNTRLRSFRRHWCLKESYVKARGDGLAFALARAEFRACFVPKPPSGPQASCSEGRAHDLGAGDAFLGWAGWADARLKEMGAQDTPHAGALANAQERSHHCDRPTPTFKAISTPDACGYKQRALQGEVRRSEGEDGRNNYSSLPASFGGSADVRSARTSGRERRPGDGCACHGDTLEGSPRDGIHTACVNGSVQQSTPVAHRVELPCEGRTAGELGRPLPSHHEDEEMSRVYVDGVLQRRWRFKVSQLPEGHLVSVALGPPDAALDALGGFKGSFGRQAITNEEMFSRLAAPSPPFRMLQVSDLVPESRVKEYEEVCSQARDQPCMADRIKNDAHNMTLRQAPRRPPMPDWFHPSNATGYSPDRIFGFGSSSRAAVEQEDCTIS